MMDIMKTVNTDFETQLTSIMEMLSKAAVVEIGKLFVENYSVLGSEISRCTNEIDSLRKKCVFLETELQSARNKTSRINRTEASFNDDGLTDPGHPPSIDNVFGKEWCMNLWRHEESNIDQNEDTNLSCSVNTVETVNLLDEEPDTILIKDEMFEDSSSKNRANSMRNTEPAVVSHERCVAVSSADFITYTMPSDGQVQVQSNLQQRQTAKQIPNARLPTHGESTKQAHLNPDEFLLSFPSNMNYSGAQNQLPALDDKKTECVLCGKNFSYLSSLKIHMRTHTGEKPFVCTVCGRRFAQKTYLTVHERTHSGERPYTCMDCGKSFAQKSSLNLHLRTHTGEKPYNCVECGKSYTYKHGFNTHQCKS